MPKRKIHGGSPPPKRQKQAPVKQKSDGLTPQLRKMREKLEGSRFRWINEQLYTSTSSEAESLFKDTPGLFEDYHKGFVRQTEKWPQNPVDIFIKELKKSKPNVVVADFGCGEAVLAKSVRQRVHSFDFVAANDRVVACDMAKVPLPSASVDIAVFSLSLMGSNYADFLLEANRVLKIGGRLKIAEVSSRIEDNKAFLELLRRLGFDLLREDHKNTHFVIFECKKSDRVVKMGKVPPLKACIYKKR